MAKSLVRREIDRRGLELIADPFGARLARAMATHGIETVIDGGANEGQFGQILRKNGFSGRILSFEPLSEAFEQLRRVAEDDPRWTVANLALSDVEGALEINIAGNSVSSSVLPMLAAHLDAAPHSAYVGSEPVLATTVDTLVAREGLDPALALLKLDVQGYEGTVLAGAHGSLGSLAGVQLELSFVPLYGGQWLAWETIDFMKAEGFELWMLDAAAMHDPKTGRLMQCDGVFFRA